MANVFDLREFALDHYHRLAGMRWFMAALGLLWCVFLVWFVTIQSSLPRLDPIQSVVFPVIYAGLGFALALSVWAVWMARLGPTALTIEDGGLVFHRISERTELLPWNKMSKGVALVDYTASPSLAKVSGRLWQLRRWNRPPTDLTREAFDAILAAASSRGLVTTSSSPRRSRWGQCRVHRFSAT